jgi:hypothetical protein
VAAARQFEIQIGGASMPSGTTLVTDNRTSDCHGADAKGLRRLASIEINAEPSRCRLRTRATTLTSLSCADGSRYRGGGDRGHLAAKQS